MKFLESQGFVFQRSVGSHYVYTKTDTGSRVTTVVPKHKELDVGTLKGILKQAKIEPNIFLQYRDTH